MTKVIKMEVPPEEKERFSEFCKSRELKESAVLRKAVKNYMEQCAPRTVTLTIKKSL